MQDINLTWTELGPIGPRTPGSQSMKLVIDGKLEVGVLS